MKLIHSIYLVPLVLLAACRSEEPFTPTRDCGPIELRAGIVEGKSAMTKAGAEDNHAKHLNLTEDTRLALSVSGIWTGHSPSPVVQATTATVGSATGADNKHNALSCSPVLYWDDYGTADPANASTGRTEGLTIYGAAIDGKTTAPTVSSWTALGWTLPTDQTTTDNTPADKDLLISNNVQGVNSDPDDQEDHGCYLFDKRTQGKLLEFTHALSKITVNLKAGAGFTGNEFASAPVVTLYESWAYTTGTLDVTTGSWSSQGNASVVTMNQNTTATTGYNVTKEALVIPGSAFASDASDIIRINADGNIYYVTAKKIRTAISTSHASDGDYATEAGKNYIINVIVNKTDIVVTATVTNWTDVISEEVSPVINVSADWGNDGDSAMADGAFSFYLSTNLNTGYGSIVGTYFAQQSSVAKSVSVWTMSPQLYWPNHNTHYQFRGVLPQTGTETGDVTYPRVETATHSAVEYQVIKVRNVAYSSGTFPADLQIARPEIDVDEQCTNNEPGHTRTYLFDGGICATEGTINLNFRYMMSQVEVNLSTTDVSALNDHVNLTGAVVEIINVYNTGDVKLGDRGVIPTGSTGSYTLNTVDGVGNENKRLSAIVPQSLTNVRFKITIHNADSTTDIYYADVAPIKKINSSELVAPNGAWESGYHYVYNLKLSKTEVKVTATLANWTTVNADEDVWF